MQHGSENPRTLVVVVAHPDDETFGCGTTIALAAEAGWSVVVCCASRGEAGEDMTGRTVDRASLAEVREAELHAAADILGVGTVELLDFADSGWEGDAPVDAIVNRPDDLRERIGRVLIRHRPSVVVTMDPSGSDGHRDHAAVGAAATAAFESVVDWPASLYHWCLPRSLMRRWVERESEDSVYVEVELGRPDGDVTTVLDGRSVRDRRRAALGAHTSQQSPYAGIPDDLADAFLDVDHLIRAVPVWTSGPLEHELLVPEPTPRRDDDHRTLPTH